MKKSGKVALGGIFCALSLLCMMLTAIPYGTYAFPAIAGVVLVPLCLEMGIKWGFAGYAAVAILSALVAPSMEAKVTFIAFFGYYPVLKTLLDRRLAKGWSWVIKLIVFNTTMVISYVLMLRFFGLESDTFELFGVNLPLVFLLAGNVVFVIFDMALSGVVQIYLRDWHPRFLRMFR